MVGMDLSLFVGVDLPAAALSAPSDTHAVLAAWRAGKSPRTLAAYADDLADFARHCELPIEIAVTRFLTGESGLAHHQYMEKPCGKLATQAHRFPCTCRAQFHDTIIQIANRKQPSRRIAFARPRPQIEGPDPTHMDRVMIVEPFA